MKQTHMVTLDLRATLAEQGYLKIDHFFTDAECDALRVRILEIIATQSDDSSTEFNTKRGEHTDDIYFMNSGDKIRFFYEKNMAKHRNEGALNKPRLLNKVGHALHDLDRVFDRFSRSERLKLLSQQLGLERALLVQSMYIFKQPHIGGEVAPHQDGTFLACEPDTMIGFWVAIEDASVENGCLWVLPEGHQNPLRSRFVRNGDTCRFLEQEAPEYDLSKMIPLEIKKGGLIVMHSLLPHMSKENSSSKSRHAYTLHVMDANSQFLKDNWLRRPAHMPFRDFDGR